MKIRLVDDWQRAWRWASVNCMVLAGAVQGAWLYIPEDMRDSVPQKVVTGITIGILVLGVIGRVFKKEPSGGENADLDSRNSAPVDKE